MEGAEFSRRHFNVAFADNFEGQVEIEAGDWPTIIPFRPEVQITGQNCYRRIKSLGLAIGIAKSGYQNRSVFVLEKLGRMGRSINRGFDSHSTAAARVPWCENLAREGSGSLLAFASQNILPDGAITGWDRP